MSEELNNKINLSNEKIDMLNTRMNEVEGNFQANTELFEIKMNNAIKDYMENLRPNDIGEDAEMVGADGPGLDGLVIRAKLEGIEKG